MQIENPKIEWRQLSGKPCLMFIFGEMLTGKEADTAVIRWKAAFQSREDKSVILVWDCRKMKGYESAARIKWTSALTEMKSRIGMIWLITESPIVQMGASIMGMISSIKIKTVHSDAELEIG